MGVVFVFSPSTNFTTEWASSLSLASATQRDAHHRPYPALTDNLSTAYNGPLCASREISAQSEEVVKQSIYFQIQPCLSLVKLCSFFAPQILPISSSKSLSRGFLHRKGRAGSQVAEAQNWKREFVASILFYLCYLVQYPLAPWETVAVKRTWNSKLPKPEF